MKKRGNIKVNIFKMLITIGFMVLLIFFITNSTKILQNPTNMFVVENGSLSYEETVTGYMIRDELVLQGENYKNGMVQAVSDNQRVAKNQTVFRYYSNGEEVIQEQIANLDKEINKALETSGINVPSSDISSLEVQIEDTINSMYNVNNIRRLEENRRKIDTYISKKAQITGLLSSPDPYVKNLIKQREDLEKQLQSGSEMVISPVSGVVSYRVDGLEEILKIDNFDYLNTELLEGFNINVGSVIPISDEKGKIVNNFNCYIATSVNTERALSAKIGDKVVLRLSTSKEVPAQIAHIIDEDDDNRIIVFYITQEIESLIEYRRISFDIIWWKYSGLKISNSAIIQESDKTYVEMGKAGTVKKVLVKVLRQNDTYSIVNNYSDAELKEEFGYTDEEIKNREQIKLYDEIILH